MNTPPANSTAKLSRALGNEIRKGVSLERSHGHVHVGKGMISGLIALFLANFSMLGVLIFQFPTYLTTPKVREAMRSRD